MPAVVYSRASPHVDRPDARDQASSPQLTAYRKFDGAVPTKVPSVAVSLADSCGSDVSSLTAEELLPASSLSASKAIFGLPTSHLELLRVQTENSHPLRRPRML